MEGPEKRKFRRLGAVFELSCNKVGSEIDEIQTGRTENVSTGGCSFLTDSNVFEPGNLLKLELTIPPKSGLFEFGGKIAGFARVLRTEFVSHSTVHSNLSSGDYPVALEFCGPPKCCL